MHDKLWLIKSGRYYYSVPGSLHYCCCFFFRRLVISCKVGRPAGRLVMLWEWPIVSVMCSARISSSAELLWEVTYNSQRKISMSYTREYCIVSIDLRSERSRGVTKLCKVDLSAHGLRCPTILDEMFFSDPSYSILFQFSMKIGMLGCVMVGTLD